MVADCSPREQAGAVPLLFAWLLMANTKPFVQMACFCENVLAEADGVLSAIRIVDTYFIPPLPEGVEMQDGMQGAIVLNGIVGLKSGDVTEAGSLRLVMHRANGETVPIGPPEGWPMVMSGGEQGSVLKIQMPLGVKNFGLMWFDVLWNGELLTRIPLKLQRGQKPESP
jgi:hypothetical protein